MRLSYRLYKLSKLILAGAFKIPKDLENYIIRQFQRNDEQNKNIHFVIDKDVVIKLLENYEYSHLIDFDEIVDFHVVVLKDQNLEFNYDQDFCNKVLNARTSKSNKGFCLSEAMGIFANIDLQNLKNILDHQLIHYIQQLCSNMFRYNYNKQIMFIINKNLVLKQDITALQKKSLIDKYIEYVNYITKNKEFQTFIRNAINVIKDKEGLKQLTELLNKYMKYDNIINLSGDLQNSKFRQTIQFLYVWYKLDRNKYKKIINKICSEVL